MQIAFQPPAAAGYIPPEIPLNEADRLADLRELDILDTRLRSGLTGSSA
jgi:hypothetical protein